MSKARNTAARSGRQRSRTRGAASWLGPGSLEDVLLGSCILGVGGGGPRVLGQSLLELVKKLGVPMIATPDDVADTAWMAVSACAGSPTAAAVDPFPYQVATVAYRELESRTEKRFDYVLAGELGAGNSFIPMLVAAKLGLPLVDASGARRAMTTLPEATFAANGVPVAPIVTADENTTVTFSTDTAINADPVLRAIISSGTFPDFAGIALWTMNGATMKRSAIPNTLAYARDLGEALRSAKGRDPVTAVCGFLNGKVLFRGKIVNVTEQVVAGFDVGRTTLKSRDGRAQCTVYNQNENLIAWNNQKSTPLAMGPDLLCWLTADGEPFTNAKPDIAKYAHNPSKKLDKEVVLIGASAPKQSRVPSIIEACMKLLRQIGYGGPYVAIEDLS
jgi:DUF917 family protein